MGFRVCFQDGLRFKVVFEPFSPLEEEICCDLLFGAKPLRYWYYWFSQYPIDLGGLCLRRV